MKKVYLAGPMRGLPLFNFPAFADAAAKLRAQGYDVFSPAERDEQVYGKCVSLRFSSLTHKLLDLSVHQFHLLLHLLLLHCLLLWVGYFTVDWANTFCGCNVYFIIHIISYIHKL